MDKLRVDRTTAIAPLPAEATRPAERFRLLVLADNVVRSTHSLAEHAIVTIGRGPENHIQIEHSSLSHCHAVIQVGRIVTVEDLGSLNGTVVRDVRIRPHVPRELGLTELIMLGEVTLIIQARFTPIQSGHLATHEYFQTRLTEECARAERSPSALFSVVGIRVASDVSNKPVASTLASTLRQSDVLATFGARTYELLLVDTDRQHAEQVARRLMSCLEAIETRGTYIVAQFPQDGRTAHALIAYTTKGAEPEQQNLIVADPAMQQLYELANRIASSDLSVLILGETGVGKEKMSRAVHDASPRATKPFVAINCAALNDTLLESELFGHERGAFTGANAMKPGLLETAEGGTVFLDEIGDMSLGMQAKLLRVIEEGEVRRVGGVRAQKIGVRFIAATNVDLETATSRGRFREDLYFRLSAATMVIPPLRERPFEIDLLARMFAARASMRGLLAGPEAWTAGGGGEFTPDAMAMLKQYAWPGNIRELRHVVERAMLLCGAGPISVEHLPLERMRGAGSRQERGPRRGEDAVREPEPAGLARPEEQAASPDERTRVLEALERAGGNQSKAATILGVSRRTLINRLEHFALPRPRKGRSRSPL